MVSHGLCWPCGLEGAHGHIRWRKSKLTLLAWAHERDSHQPAVIQAHPRPRPCVSPPASSSLNVSLLHGAITVLRGKPISQLFCFCPQPAPPGWGHQFPHKGNGRKANVLAAGHSLIPTEGPKSAQSSPGRGGLLSPLEPWRGSILF